jgi:hypothetical protein
MFLANKQASESEKDQLKTAFTDFSSIKDVHGHIRSLICGKDLTENAVSHKILTPNSKETLDDDVVTHVVDFLVVQLQNHRAMFTSGSRSLQYNSTVLQLAFSIYAQSRSAYTMLRNSGLLIMPSTSSIKKYMSSSYTYEGDDMGVYARVYHSEMMHCSSQDFNGIDDTISVQNGMEILNNNEKTFESSKNLNDTPLITGSGCGSI